MTNRTSAFCVHQNHSVNQYRKKLELISIWSINIYSMSLTISKPEVKSHVIGLCGPMDSGVHIAAQHLADRGFSHFEIRSANTSASGFETTDFFSGDHLDKWLNSFSEPQSKLVISGLSQILQAQHIKEVGGKIVFIDSDPTIRRSRFLGHISLDDMENLKPIIKNESDLAKIRQLHDVVLLNNGTKQNLFGWLDYLLNKEII